MVWSSRKPLAATLALVLLAWIAAPGPAVAQLGLMSPPPKDGFAGRYTYKHVPVPPKWDPACVAHWSLGADGAYRLEAGQRIDEGKWAVTYDKTGQSWLTLTKQRSNGLPNCAGWVAKAPIEDLRTTFYINSEGGLVLTYASRQLSSGQLIYDIWATLSPAP